MNFTKRVLISAGFFFIFMFVFMTFISPLAANEPINFDRIWTDVIIWAIGSLIYGFVMAKFVFKPQPQEKTS